MHFAILMRVGLILISLLFFFSCRTALAQSDLTFPQIIVGESFETLVLVANEIAVEDVVVFETFYGSQDAGRNGNPFPVELNQSEAKAKHELNLGPYEEKSARIHLDQEGLTVGWLRIRSLAEGGKVSASVFYRVKSGDLLLDSLGVPTSRRYRFAQVQFDDTDESSATGVAFVNPDDTAVQVTIDLFDGEQHIARYEHELDPRMHFAKLISEIFPAEKNRQGSLILETSASRAIPILTVKLDDRQWTSLPARPLGFTLQYEIRSESDQVIESGYWILESEGFYLIGKGRNSQSQEYYDVSGNWFGRSFQCIRRKTYSDNSFGIVVFNGASAGDEVTHGAPISGTVTELGPDGYVLSVNDFIAFNKY